MNRAGFAGAFAVATLLSSLAGAQVPDRRNFDANRLRPALSREGVINVESAETSGHLSVDVALWYNYANDPVVLNEGDDRFASLLKDRHDGHLVVSFGVLDMLQFGLDIPVTLEQTRSRRAVRDLGLDELDARGVGDLAFTPKLRLLHQDRVGIDVAALVRVTFPTASPSENYLGERRVTATPELAVSRTFGGLTLAGNLGFLFRDDLPSPVLDADIDHEAIVRLGIAYDFAEHGAPIRLNASAEGFTELRSPFDQENLSGAEWLGAIEAQLHPVVALFAGGGTALAQGYSIPDWRAFGGLRFTSRDEPVEEPPPPPPPAEPTDTDGDGLIGKDDGCPDEPEDFDDFEDADGCPDPDNDDDGVLDGDDGEPLIPEDRDGFEDDDGVPDPDNDGDGIADVDDGAPDDPEDPDGFQDTDGVPDLDNDQDGVADMNDQCPLEPGPMENAGCKNRPLVIVRGCSFDLSQKVYFRTGRSELRPRSFTLLQGVAELLKSQPQIQRVRIEGHTDAQGPERSNQRLSQARADSVRTFLLQQGIGPERLDAVGFGESTPIDTNATAIGRENNRRVEFKIADCVEEGASVGAP